MKRSWQASGAMVHDTFVTITCKNGVQARRLVDVLDLVYIEGQQSVLKAIGDLAGVPMAAVDYQASMSQKEADHV